MPHPETWLIPYQNPLPGRQGVEFFRKLPQGPGVYLMVGEAGAILYVGKAKNLRARLSSYKRARPGQVSRKVMRMIHLIREIRIEICDSEKTALLRENQLLREIQPPFNTVNTHPESYYFIGFRSLGQEVRLRLTTSPKRQGDLLFGAYKGRGSVREGYQALLRLIWASSASEPRFEFPTRLTSYRPIYTYSVKLARELLPHLRRFLSGRSAELLPLLTERLLQNPTIPPFAYRLIQEDLERLQCFFDRCPGRNRELRKNHQIRGRLIAQAQLDDLLVLDLARRGKIGD